MNGSVYSDVLKFVFSVQPQVTQRGFSHTWSDRQLFVTLARTLTVDTLIKSLPMIIRAAGDDAQVVQAAAMAAWKNAAGDGLRNHAQPIALSGQTMIVAVPDSAWQKQLGFLKAELLFRINNLLGRPLVTDIELRIDRRLRQKPKDTSQSSTDLVESDVPPDLLAAARAIEDEQLSRKFLRAAVSVMKSRERRGSQD
jgi:hypothetical protein